MRQGRRMTSFFKHNKINLKALFGKYFYGILYLNFFERAKILGISIFNLFLLQRQSHFFIYNLNSTVCHIINISSQVLTILNDSRRMQLSVEEIVTKVAREKQFRQQQQEQLRIIQQIKKHKPSDFINNSSFKAPFQKSSQPVLKKSFLAQNSKSKNQIKPPKYPSQLQKSTTNDLKQKYKALKLAYKRLSSKLQHEIKVDQKYIEIKQKLSKVIKQNEKLQKKLDELRTKRLFYTETQSQTGRKQNQSKTSAMQISGDGAISKRNDSVKVQKDCKIKQKDSIFCDLGKSKSIHGSHPTHPVQTNRALSPQMQRQQIFPVSKFEQSIQVHHDSINEQPQSQLQNVLSDLREQILPVSIWIDQQKDKYMSMICQKQISIQKLKTILIKQERILQQYSNLEKEDQFNFVNQMKNPGENIITTSNRNKGHKNVEGTIVKIKKNKLNEASNSNRGNTKRSHTNYQAVGDFVNNPQSQMGQKTKKKNNFMVIQKQSNKQAFLDHASLLQPNDISKSNPYSRYLQRKQLEQNYSYHSPSESINQTSEFICEQV